MNYSELQIAIHDKLQDDGQIAQIPRYIALFEGKVRRGLRVRQMEARATATPATTGEALALPGDFLEPRSMKIDGQPESQLIFLPPNQLAAQFGGMPDKPQAYAIVGAEFIFGPPANALYTYELDYYYFTPLSAAAPSNWLSEDYPDAYLYGALGNANGEAAMMWRALADQILDDLQEADRGARYNGSPLISVPSEVVV